MYSVFVSRITLGMKLVNNDIKEFINCDSSVLILPWAFPFEIDSDRLLNEYFKVGSEKYNKYVDSLVDLGIKSENIYIGDCYRDSTLELREKINNVDILLLPGGNPEMFFRKVIHDKELLYDIKYFKGLIIGESAGCVLHLKRYFITAKNNYYKYFAWYDGFGIIDDPFYIDVHTIKNKLYLDKLQRIANEKRKTVYAIFDDGAIIFNRSNNELKKYGNVLEFNVEK